MVGPFGIISDVSYNLTKWVVTSTYSGVKYLAWGSPKSPELVKLEEIEDQLKSRNTPDLVYYWDISSKYDPGTWLVIRDQALIFITSEKAEALRTIAELMDEGGTRTYLLIQVGNEHRHCIL